MKKGKEGKRKGGGRREGKKWNERGQPPKYSGLDPPLTESRPRMELAGSLVRQV